MIKRKEVKPLLSVDVLGPGEKSKLGDSDVLDLKNVSALAITVRCTHHSSATAPVKVHLLSSPDGSVWDTEPYASFNAHLLPGQESQKTVAVTPDIFLLRVQLENSDSTYEATDIDVIAVVGYEE